MAVHVQHFIDKDGYELKDLTILEEAVSGDFTGYLRITAGNADGKVSQRYHIEYGVFRIKGYESGEFIIEISKPVNIKFV